MKRPWFVVAAGAFAILGVALAWLALNRPTQVTLTPGSAPDIIYLLLAGAMFGMAGFAASRRAKTVGADGPGAFTSLLIWTGLLGLAVVLYRGGEIWTALLSLFR